MSIKGKDLELAIKGYWCGRFGLEPADWERSWTHVFGDEVFAGTPEIYLTRFGKMTVARLDPAKREWVDWPAELGSTALDVDALIARAAEGHGIKRAGAGLSLYLDPDEFRPAAAVAELELRRLDGKAEWPLVKSLLEGCSEEEVDDAEIYEDDPDAVVFGGFAGERLVCYAGFRYWEEKFADIGILTHPEFRRRGVGKWLVSALCEWCLENGVIPMYRVDPENSGSRRIAEALGFALWARIDVLNFEES
jgi:GNAT superfamily N-acetyltransferase